MKMRAEKEKHSDSISTLLGADARIEGVLDFGGTLRLDGELQGTLTGTNGTLIVGEKARVKADIAVRNAVIMGEIAGSVEASEKIELYPPGKVTGDISAPVITIESGAVLNGRCLMKKPADASPKPAAAVPTKSPAERAAPSDG